MKKAFTIMEVLVTIAIVGIIGATIMGNIISTKPDPKVMAFRSSYYGLQQAVTEAVNNKYFYDQSNINNRIYNPAAYSDTGNKMLATTGGIGGGGALQGFPPNYPEAATLPQTFCRIVASYLNLQQFTWKDKPRYNHCDGAIQDVESDSNIIALGAADNTQNFILFNGAKVYGLRSRHKTVNDDTGQPKNCPIPVIIDVNGNDGPNLLYHPNNNGGGYTTDVNNVDRFRVKISPAGKVYIGYDADEENIRYTETDQDCNLFGARTTTLPDLFRPERAILSDPSKNKTTAE